jgi:hypothetical protein
VVPTAARIIITHHLLADYLTFNAGLRDFFNRRLVGRVNSKVTSYLGNCIMKIYRSDSIFETVFLKKNNSEKYS